MIDLDRFQKALTGLPHGVEAVEFNAGKHSEISLRICGGAQAGGEAFSRAWLYARAGVGGNTGCVYTERLDDDPSALVAAAAQCAAHVRGGKPISRAGSVRVACAEPNDSIDDMTEFGVALEAAAQRLENVSAVKSCSVRRRSIAYHTVNSMNADNEYEESLYIVSLGIELAGQALRRAQANTMVYAKTLSELNVADIAQSAREKAALRGLAAALEPRTVRSGSQDAVLLSDVAAAMMLTAWMGIVGAHVNAGLAIYPFDPACVVRPRQTFPPTWANRAKPTRMDLPAGGVLERPANPQGNALVCSTPTRLFIKPGPDSVKNLIAGMENGMLVTDAYDVIHAVNPANGQFEIICSGIVYEAGRPVGAFDQLTMSGNMQDLFRNIKGAANDIEHHEFMNKNYAYGSPSIRVGDMMFSCAR